MSESAEVKIESLEMAVKLLSDDLAAANRKIAEMGEEIAKLTKQNIFQQISIDSQNENIEELQASSIEKLLEGI